jgi:hypothetical protein
VIGLVAQRRQRRRPRSTPNTTTATTTMISTHNHVDMAASLVGARAGQADATATHLGKQLPASRRPPGPRSTAALRAGSRGLGPTGHAAGPAHCSNRRAGREPANRRPAVATHAGQRRPRRPRRRTSDTTPATIATITATSTAIATATQIHSGPGMARLLRLVADGALGPNLPSGLIGAASHYPATGPGNRARLLTGGGAAWPSHPGPARAPATSLVPTGTGVPPAPRWPRARIDLHASLPAGPLHPAGPADPSTGGLPPRTLRGQGLSARQQPPARHTLTAPGPRWPGDSRSPGAGEDRCPPVEGGRRGRRPGGDAADPDPA